MMFKTGDVVAIQFLDHCTSTTGECIPMEFMAYGRVHCESESAVTLLAWADLEHTPDVDDYNHTFITIVKSTIKSAFKYKLDKQIC